MDQPIVPIEYLVLGPIQNNVWLLGDDRGLVVVDPGCHVQEILAAIDGRPVDAIVLTHGHWDHVGAAKALRDATGAPVAAGAQDVPAITGEVAFEGHRRFEPCPVDRVMDDGDELQAGGTTWRVLATPGHSPGSICLFAEGADGRAPILIAGDTLFQGTHGRTDFEGGDPAAMEQSLARLAQLPADTVVLPGHNAPTTIDQERRWLP